MAEIIAQRRWNTFLALGWYRPRRSKSPRLRRGSGSSTLRNRIAKASRSRALALAFHLPAPDTFPPSLPTKLREAFAPAGSTELKRERRQAGKEAASD